MNEKEGAEAFVGHIKLLKKEIGRVIVAQHQTIDLILLALFCDGHALLVGLPGLAKTLMVQTIAQCLRLSFHRIQFTPDLMPSDITGSEIMDKERYMRFVKGPVFTNVLLADEINRTPPKTQAALLEAMQEKMVTVAGTDYTLAPPFFTLATQNPIEQEGTYPLPEAQLDRFMLQIAVQYPSLDEEIAIVKRTTTTERPSVSPVMDAKEVLYYQQLVRAVPVTDSVLRYAIALVHRTRPDVQDDKALATRYLQWGAGPRASQYLILGAKCHALMRGAYAPDKEDVQAVASAVLSHRVIPNFKATAERIVVRDLIGELL